MLNKTINLYKNAYGGLSSSTWLLSVILLINRSGSMVVPFLTLYLTQHLNYSIGQAGIVMATFGVGAIIGAYMGGRLSDKIGFYPIQFWSLFLNGFLFIALAYMQTLPQIMICVFVSSLIGEAFRPANASAIAFYSSPENRTRSYSLNRLAVNLGWAVGPAIGGILASFSYPLLFWVDGLTCIAAAIMMRVFLKPVKKLSQATPPHRTEKSNINSGSAYRDRIYIWFIILVTLNAICFFQLFSIVPLFYKQIVHLNEMTIGLIMSLNGLIIVFIEMILIYKIDGKRPALWFISYGVILTGCSFLIFNVGHSGIIVIISMLLITFGEMFSMPFMNSFWISRSSEQNRGQYAALYTIAYSAAHILAPTLGSRVVQYFGFSIWWYVVGVMCLISSVGFGYLNKRLQNSIIK